MKNYLFIGIIAGLCTALLNLSGYAGGMIGLGVILVILSPLPIMIASLGWGSFVGLIAVVSSGATLALLLGPLAGLLFAGLNSLPAWWLSHLCGLQRTDQATGETHWYPLDRLLLWLAGIATVASLAVFIPFGFSLDQYRDAISALMRQIYEAQSGANVENAVISFDDLVTIVSRLAPTASALMIVFSSAVNLYLAGKITHKSGHLARPWPNMQQLTAAPLNAYIFLVGLTAFFLLDGLPGVMAQIIASSFGATLLLVGLSVLHYLTRFFPARLPLLWITYFLLMVFQWIGIVLIILGAAEALLNVRSRSPKPPQGPTTDMNESD